MPPVSIRNNGRYQKGQILSSYPAAPVPDYADENVSTKVVKIIQSYAGIVDRMVWRKY